MTGVLGELSVVVVEVHAGLLIGAETDPLPSGSPRIVGTISGARSAVATSLSAALAERCC